MNDSVEYYSTNFFNGIYIGKDSNPKDSFFTAVVNIRNLELCDYFLFYSAKLSVIFIFCKVEINILQSITIIFILSLSWHHFGYCNTIEYI